MARYEFFNTKNGMVGQDMTVEESLGYSAMSILVTIAILAVIAALFASIVPSLMFVLLLFIKNRKTLIKLSLIGGISALYFMIDYTQGWICWGLFDSFKSLDFYYKLSGTNLTLLIIHIISIIFLLSKENYEEEVIEDGKSYNPHLLIIFIISMFISGLVIKNNILPKYVKPTKIEKSNYN